MSAFDVWVIIVGANVAFSIILAAILSDTRRRQSEDRANFRMHITASGHNLQAIAARLDRLEQAAKPKPEPEPCPESVGVYGGRFHWCSLPLGHESSHEEHDEHGNVTLRWTRV